MTEDMKLVHSCIPAINDLADSGRSSGMILRAESMALNGFLYSVDNESSWSKKQKQPNKE
jgi:hypothetical protein